VGMGATRAAAAAPVNGHSTPDPALVGD